MNTGEFIPVVIFVGLLLTGLALARKTNGGQSLTEHFQLQSRTVIFSLPVLFCELAVFSNVHTMYSYFENWLQAILLALSFSVLLIGSVMIAARDIPQGVRYLLIAGGLSLFLVQTISSISGAFLNALDIFPAIQLVRLWGGEPQQLTAWFSILFALIINVVCAIYYVALSLLLRIEEQGKEEKKRQLRDLEQLLH